MDQSFVQEINKDILRQKRNTIEPVQRSPRHSSLAERSFSLGGLPMIPEKANAMAGIEMNKIHPPARRHKIPTQNEIAQSKAFQDRAKEIVKASPYAR